MTTNNSTRFIALVPKQKYRKVVVYAVDSADFSAAYDSIFESVEDKIRSGAIHFTSSPSTTTIDAFLGEISEVFERPVKAKIFDLVRDTEEVAV